MEIDDMKEAIGFRLRLQVRLGTLGTDEVCLTTRLAGREVTLKSREDGQPISKAKWIILEARGFATEPEARGFGERLRANVQLAAICSGLGADAGEEQALSWFNEDLFRSNGWLAPHQRFGPDVHGLSVLPDDDDTVFLYSEVQVTKTSNSDLFLDAMRELAGQPSITESAFTLPVRLLSLAHINQSFASIVLAFSAVEMVAQDESWSDNQRVLIKKLAVEITDHADGDRERLEVAEALQRMHRIGVRQGVKRVLCRNGLSHLRKEWDRLYDLRSSLFHGSKQLTEQEVNSLENGAMKLCSRIILGIIKRNGINLPSVAIRNFGEI